MSSNYVVELEKDEVIQGSHKNNKNDEVTEDGDFITGLDTRSNKANDSIDSLNRQHTWIERMANRKSIIELIHGPKLSRRDSVVVYGKTFLIDNNLRWRIRHVSGLYTLFRDVDLELMIFCKGNIYRDTGTTSRLVEDSNYSRSKSLEEGRSVGRSSASKA
eukprot:g6432.t1